MATFLTRAIQRRHGYEPAVDVCPDCGHEVAAGADFPHSNVVGVRGWRWSSRRRPPLGRSIRCPRCGAALSFDEEQGPTGPAAPPLSPLSPAGGRR